MGLFDNIFTAPRTISWDGGGTTQTQGGAFGSFGNALKSLQPLADQLSAGQNEQTMNDVFYANPEFASQLYGAKNQQAQLAIMQQEEQRKQRQQSALAKLAEQIGAQTGQASPAMASLGQLAAISGDPTALINYQLAQEKLQSEKGRTDALSRIMTGNQGYDPGINPNGRASSPLNVRNNNPGNMKDPATGEFQSFGSPEEGMQKMAADLTQKIMGKSPAMAARYGDGYQPTLNNVIGTWAPPTENDTGNYVDFVSKQTGIKPDQVLSPMDIQKLIPAMTQMEGGQQATNYFNPASEPVEAQPLEQEQPAQNPVLEKLRQAAQVDPEKYGPAYLQAQMEDVQNDEKRILEAKKTERESAKNLTEGERDLRKEFEGLPDVKQFRDVEGAYQRITKAAGKPTAAGDIALIFNYMKMLDPGSTVREGEFATAQNAAGIPTQVWNMYNKAKSGERLAPEQRADFLAQAKEQYFGAEDLFNVRADQYQNLAKQYEYKPERIVTRARSDIKRTEDKAALVDPALMEFMTPEERALFQ